MKEYESFLDQTAPASRLEALERQVRIDNSLTQWDRARVLTEIAGAVSRAAKPPPRPSSGS